MTAALDIRQSLGEIESACSKRVPCPSDAAAYTSDSQCAVAIQVSLVTQSDARIDGNRMTGGASLIEQAARGQT